MNTFTISRFWWEADDVYRHMFEAGFEEKGEMIGLVVAFAGNSRDRDLPHSSA